MTSSPPRFHFCRSGLCESDLRTSPPCHGGHDSEHLLNYPSLQYENARSNPEKLHPEYLPHATGRLSPSPVELLYPRRVSTDTIEPTTLERLDHVYTGQTPQPRSEAPPGFVFLPSTIRRLLFFPKLEIREKEPADQIFLGRSPDPRTNTRTRRTRRSRLEKDSGSNVTRGRNLSREVDRVGTASFLDFFLSRPLCLDFSERFGFGIYDVYHRINGGR